jgi:hypothetical protein
LGETEVHLALVRTLVRYATWRLREFRATAVFADLPSVSRRDKPPRIGGFVPDVYASDVPTTFSLLGEAKSLEDLETTHTALQLAAFCRHARFCNGAVVVAVPTVAVATARALLRRCAVSVDAASLELSIIDEAARWE